MFRYRFRKIEKKWQDIWDKKNCFAASDNVDKLKYYVLIEFPYPSGEGLHVGHPRSYVALDVIARKRRLENFNVLYPIGWDAFGLPTENYAIKNKIHPKTVTENNIKNFKRQLKSLGISFDWNREVSTVDPCYYKWTQWIFSRLFERGLAEKRETLVNWCLGCKCVLANEEVIAGKCERCSYDVIQKKKPQWVLKITEYADRLADDLDHVDYPERVKLQQRNWIGRSKGVKINFETDCGERLEIYTTRPETIFGATYMVMAPEHKIIDKYSEKITNIDEIIIYRKKTARKSEFERTQIDKEKTGVEIKGIKAINPFSGDFLPIFVSDYVLGGYGSGAVMAVPAHDERDHEFARKFDLPMKEVISENGKIINSNFLNGLEEKDGKKKITEKIVELGIGEEKINFKLRDWIFSRQRYWGEPIPIINCPKCGLVLDENLPLVLPELEDFEPTEDGGSALAKSNWVKVKCPKCGIDAERETDTMPQWAGSSWYFLRYIDPFNDNEIASEEKLRYWLPVDWYNGGMEHTTLHLLYSRFWHKFLFDIGVLPTSEPYAKRTSHGIILGENGEKMSKSRGNVVNPDDIIFEYGADVMRLYEMFIGDFENAAPWSTTSIRGCKRFLEKYWLLREILISGEIRPEMKSAIHRTIKKVENDIENLKFNTAIAAMMALTGSLRESSVTTEELKILTILLNPFAPHITEEMWETCNFGGSIREQIWPSYDESAVKGEKTEIAIQVDGKTKGKIIVDSDETEENIVAAATMHKAVLGKIVVKKIYVPGKLVNFVLD
jgi:leucyl-tRNA synthetase